jgi:hypothetical protein
VAMRVQQFPPFACLLVNCHAASSEHNHHHAVMMCMHSCIAACVAQLTPVRDRLRRRRRAATTAGASWTAGS